MLKPFLPQLQRTFVKALTDTNPTVRQRAASALGILIPLQPQVESLVKELEKGIREEADEIKEAMLAALWQVLDKSGASTSTESCDSILKMTSDFFNTEKDTLRRASAVCQGALLCSSSMPDDAVRALVVKTLFRDDATQQQRAAYVQVVEVLVAKKPHLLLDESDLEARTLDWIAVAVEDGSFAIVETAIRTIGRLLHGKQFGVRCEERFRPVLVSILTDKPADAKRLALLALTAFAQRHSGVGSVVEQVTSLRNPLGPCFPITQHISLALLAATIPLVMTCVKDRNIPVKLAGEKCLLHLLRLRQGEDLLQSFLGSVTPAEAKQLGDYHKRVLVKLLAAETDRQLNPDERDVDRDDLAVIVEPPAL